MFGRKGVKSGQQSDNATFLPPSLVETGRTLANRAGEHSLHVAARLAALFGTQDYRDDSIEFIRIREITDPCVCDLSGMDGNPVGLSFSFDGEDGESGLVYLTTAFAQLAPHGADPSPRVPASMISQFVHDYDEAIRKLVSQRTPHRSPKELEQEQWVRSQLKQFLG